jgi:hypothetical protein
MGFVLLRRGRIGFGGGAGVRGEMVRVCFQLRSAIVLRLCAILYGLLVPDVLLSLVHGILSGKKRLSGNRESVSPLITDLAVET